MSKAYAIIINVVLVFVYESFYKKYETLMHKFLSPIQSILKLLKVKIFMALILLNYQYLQFSE